MPLLLANLRGGGGGAHRDLDEFWVVSCRQLGSWEPVPGASGKGTSGFLRLNMTLLGSEHSLLIRSKFRSVLQLRLQQRRTQEQLANQGIIPPLKSPTEFHEQRKNLDSDKTENSLKRKGRNRSDPAHLVNMHILQASTAERSIPTAQMKLKRARLADDLNEKIALRPGPLELVEKNILPVDSAVKQAIKGS
uniref:Phosphatase and actin regulator n=1 Tax=Castor canadensis TaxID=51338 RepID=A0A8B7WHS0_CASCN|nr:myocardin-like [Castor canadensis]